MLRGNANVLKGKYIGSNKNFKRESKKCLFKTDRRYHNRYSVTFYKTNIHEVKEKNISAITVYRYLSYVVKQRRLLNTVVCRQ